MAITALTGLPGSGKSYRVAGDMMGKDFAARWFVVHNVVGLVPASYPGLELRSFEDVADALGCPLVDIFNLENQTALVEMVKGRYNKQVLLIIDEAQNVFGKKTPEHVQWLSYHRHLDQDVWLVTQNLRNIDRAYQRLVEIEIRAKKGAVFPLFLYQHRAEGTKIAVSYRRKNKAVFAAYQSFDQGVGRTGSRSMLLPSLGVVALVAIGYGVWLSKGGLWADQVEVARSEAAAVAAPVVPSSASHGAPIDELPPRLKVWSFGGRVGGRYQLYNGKELRPLAMVLPDAQVLRVDPVRRELVLVDGDLGVIKIRNRPVQVEVKEYRGRVFEGDDVEVEHRWSEWWVWIEEGGSSRLAGT